MKLRIRRAFTLVELLVVIAIISILATAVTVSTGSARMRSRDARRIEDLSSVASALELYYGEVGHYPKNTSWMADCWKGNNNWISDGDNGNPEAGTNYNWSNNYLQNQPHDPVNTCNWPWSNDGNPTATYAYYAGAVANGGYALVARLEDGNNKSTVKNAGTTWFDGNKLYDSHGWNQNAYVIRK